MNPFIYSVIIVVALALSSFFNVCISRIPEQKSLLLPSFCPRCNSKIKWYDNIPLLSFVVLRGRCRSCHSRISLRYPLVEFLGTALIIFALWHLGLNARGLLATAMLCLLFIVAVIDFERQIIPNKLVVAGVLLSFGRFFFEPFWPDAFWGAIVGGGFLLAAGEVGRLLFKKRSMGAGDVKFAAMLGIFIGAKGIFVSLLLAIFLAAFGGTIAILSGKLRRSRIPFGPFIAAATGTYILFPSMLNTLFYNLYGF